MQLSQLDYKTVQKLSNPCIITNKCPKIPQKHASYKPAIVKNPPKCAFCAIIQAFHVIIQALRVIIHACCVIIQACCATIQAFHVIN